MGRLSIPRGACILPRREGRGFPVAEIEKTCSLIYNNAMAYKVVETSTVTDEEIERILNEWTGKGFVFESIQFVNAVSSKRPVMAFVFFTSKEKRDTMH